MPRLAYLNGRFCPIEEAMVSIEDRGFTFADGVYESAAAYQGKPFRLRQHLDRLKSSLAGIHLDFDIDAYGLTDVIEEGLKLSDLGNTMVYIQITRGAAPRAHIAPEGMTPTVVLTFKPLGVVSAEDRQKGWSVRTMEEFRWPFCYIKSIALLPNVMAKNQAIREGYNDVIFITSDGEVREGSSSNVYIVKNGKILTPPKLPHILHGITRSFLIECATSAGIPMEEAVIMREDLEAADEVFLSSTSIDAMPVTRIDGDAVGTGKPGPVSRKMHEQFFINVEEELGVRPPSSD